MIMIKNDINQKCASPLKFSHTHARQQSRKWTNFASMSQVLPINMDAASNKPHSCVLVGKWSMEEFRPRHITVAGTQVYVYGACNYVQYNGHVVGRAPRLLS